MKILIFSASTGGGHKRAAAAIESKIKSLSPETDVAVVDATVLWLQKRQNSMESAIKLPTEKLLCTKQ